MFAYLILSRIYRRIPNIFSKTYCLSKDIWLGYSSQPQARHCRFEDWRNSSTIQLPIKPKRGDTTYTQLLSLMSTYRGQKQCDLSSLWFLSPCSNLLLQLVLQVVLLSLSFLVIINKSTKMKKDRVIQLGSSFKMQREHSKLIVCFQAIQLISKQVDKARLLSKLNFSYFS